MIRCNHSPLRARLCHFFRRVSPLHFGLASLMLCGSVAASAAPLTTPVVVGQGSSAGVGASNAADAAYAFSPDDQFSVSVLGHPEFSLSSVTVLPDGTFNFPVIGSVRAEGKTTSQLAADLRASLVADGQLNAPDVTVTIIESRPRNVSVIGDVKTPGLYVYKSGWHLLDVIAACGGPLQEPQLTQATLIKAGASEGVKIDMVKLMSGADLSQDYALEPGDIVMVQHRDPDLAEVQVTGDVKSPGQFAVDAAGAPVLAVITQAGGATDNAALSRVQIMHAGQVRAVNLRTAMNTLDASVNSIRVYAGDTVVVPDNIAQIAVFGEVSKPAVFPLPDGQPMTVASALSMAGGLTDEGDRKQIAIVRSDPATGKQVVTTVDLDEYLKADSKAVSLQPNDIVYVPGRHKGHSGTEAFGALSGLGGLAAILHFL